MALLPTSAGSSAGEPRRVLWRTLLGELYGTMFLVAAGTGAVVSNSPGGTPTIIPMWVFGGVVYALIGGLGSVCDVHINPNVTLAAMLTGATPVLEGTAIMLAQMIGGATGAAFLWLVLPPSLDGSATCGHLAPRLAPWQGMLIEAAGTCLLVTIVLLAVIHSKSPADPTGPSGPQAVFLALVAAIGFSGPLTSAGLNYARIFGPALVFDCWDDAWVWPVGEALGSLLAVASAALFAPHLAASLLPFSSSSSSSSAAAAAATKKTQVV